MIAVSLHEHAGSELTDQRQEDYANGFPFYFGRHVGGSVGTGTEKLNDSTGGGVDHFTDFALE